MHSCFIKCVLITVLSTIATTNSGCAATNHPGPYSTASSTRTRNTLAAQQANEEGLLAIEDGEYTNAESQFRAALDEDIFYSPAHNNLGLVLLRQGKAYEAAWEFQFAARLSPNAAEPRNNLGLVLERVTRFDEAIAQYEQALAIQPNNAQTMGHLARARIKAGDKSDDLMELLKKLSFQKSDDRWDLWARRQILALQRDRQ